MQVRLSRRLELLGALALSALTGACASGTAPLPFPMPRGPIPIVERPRTEPPVLAAPDAPPVVDAPLAESAADAIVRTALGLRGAPYRSGGSDPQLGFDCSGFTQYVFAQTGAHLPRDTREQFQLGEKVKVDELQPGDLIFFATTSKHVSHVGIALGDDRFVHAPSSHGVVRIESMNLPYWKRRLVGVRRIADAN